MHIPLLVYPMFPFFYLLNVLSLVVALRLYTIILFILCQLLFIDFLVFLFYNLLEINNNTRGGLHGKNDRC